MRKGNESINGQLHMSTNFELKGLCVYVNTHGTYISSVRTLFASLKHLVLLICVHICHWAEHLLVLAQKYSVDLKAICHMLGSMMLEN